jgi:glycosyltransferase involved in cell wall biosynthesis
MPAFCKLVEYLDRSGWHVEIVFISRDPQSRAHVSQVFAWPELPNVRVRVIPVSRCYSFRFGWVAGEIMLDLRLLGILGQRGIDIAYFDRANINFAAMAKLLGKKVVVRLFGVADLPEYLSTRRWRVFRRLRYWSFRAPYDYVICSKDGSAGAAFMRRYLNAGVPREMLYNGAASDPALHQAPAGTTGLRRQYGLSDDAIILLSTGRVESDRNLMTLLSVVSEMKQEFELFVVIVGEGSEFETLRTAATHLGLDEHILFSGLIPHSQVYQMLHQADIYVSLCIFRSLGNDVLEAMRSAKCIVALDTCRVTGRDEEFKDPELRGCVRLVDRERMQDSLHEELGFLLRNTDQIPSYGRRVAAWATKNVWSWDERLRYEERILRKVIRSTVGGG